MFKVYFTPPESPIFGERVIFNVGELETKGDELYHIRADGSREEIRNHRLSLYLGNYCIGIYSTGKIARNLDSFRHSLKNLEIQTKKLRESMNETGTIIFYTENGKVHTPKEKLKKIADELFK